MPTALHSKSRILDISQPIVMGILNATPDSFYNKGQSSDTLSLLHAAEKMIKEGAAIIDIGGASTRPGQPLIHADQELMRVIPAIKAIHEAFPDTWLSIDTYNSKVAREAIEAGVDIVNDVSSGRFDKEMLQVVASLGTPYIIMHILGTPEIMQLSPAYGDVVKEVYEFLEDMCKQCASAGIKEVIIDPGFGFGKTVEHNFSLLKSLSKFAGLEKIIMAGLSRKSMICKPLKVNPDHALNGTTALNMVALQQGAGILRVHDVKEAMEVIKLWKLLEK